MLYRLNGCLQPRHDSCTLMLPHGGAPVLSGTPVYLEVSQRTTFCGAVEWPGWERGGRDEASAITAFLAAGPRYRRAMGAAARDLKPPGSPEGLALVERHPGDSATDFGIPSVGPIADNDSVDDSALTHLKELLRAAWVAFDRAAKAAVGVELRKGPRGGGRDLEKIREHISGAERSYLYQLGGRHSPQLGEAADDELLRLREESLELLAARAQGEAVNMGRRTAPLWTVRYYVRRSMWHLLDHAWEIEDRAPP